jgi:hypothetical protein
VRLESPDWDIENTNVTNGFDARIFCSRARVIEYEYEYEYDKARVKNRKSKLPCP